MVKKIILISVLLLCLLGLMTVPLLYPDKLVINSLFTSSAYAQASRILIEGADSVLSQELQESEQLNSQAAGVAPRILVEYADSILSLNLEPPVPLVQPTTPTPTPTPTPEPPPEPEQPVLEPGQPQPPPEPIPEPTPVPSSPTPWWLEPQWLVSAIIAGLACIAGIIRLVIVLRRGS